MVNIRSAVWENAEHTLMTVIVEAPDYGFGEIPYGVNFEQEDDAPIYQEIVEAYRNGEFEPDPYVPFVYPDEVIARKVRYERNKRIAETDYLLMPDYPLEKEEREELLEYRKALRDIPSRKSFPNNIVWPDLPKFLAEDEDLGVVLSKETESDNTKDGGNEEGGAGK